tara:strand:- start:35778 stop:36509 length:732 start_codon:yes stop_codon:yes gene_type:complete
MVNKMKTFLTILLLFSLGAYSSMNAQPNRVNAQPGVQNFIVQYGDVLELTDQQKSELLTLQADRRSAMQSGRQSGRMGQQQRAVRGQQKGVMRPNSNINRLDRSNFAALRSEHRNAMMDILTDEQKAKLLDIQRERVENRSEVRMLQNRTLVERTISDSDKAEEVIDLLNRITEIQKENQLHRIENSGEPDREMMVENVTEIRSIQDELMSKITVTEYRTLRPAFANGRQRSAGRGMGIQRNR